MIPKDYVCDGQLNIWDYMTISEPEPYEPISENTCRFSRHECNMEESHRIAYMDLDILNCPEVCCRNCDIRLCGARCNGSKEPDPLPSLEEVVGIVSEKFGLQFEKATWGWKDKNYFMYVAKYKGAKFEVDESTYTGGRLNGERFIGVNWSFGTSGSGRGTDTINDVLSFFERRMKETDNLKEKKKKKGRNDGD